MPAALSMPLTMSPARNAGAAPLTLRITRSPEWNTGRFPCDQVHSYQGALLLALGAGVSVSAQHRLTATAVDETIGVGIDQAPMVHQAGLPTPRSSMTSITKKQPGVLGHADASRLSLSDEERGFVFLGVVDIADVPDVPRSRRRGSRQSYRRR